MKKTLKQLLLIAALVLPLAGLAEARPNQNTPGNEPNEPQTPEPAPDYLVIGGQPALMLYESLKLHGGVERDIGPIAGRLRRMIEMNTIVCLTEENSRYLSYRATCSMTNLKKAVGSSETFVANSTLDVFRMFNYDMERRILGDTMTSRLRLKRIVCEVDVVQGFKGNARCSINRFG